ncbi:hypothetical protein [Nocardia sp. NPDC047038]|uniref:hypothetical protein n=1 Tax=Nocardia sp. NPDC047038 TaxID=3154338 RepID=UPI0033C5C5FD
MKVGKSVVAALVVSAFTAAGLITNSATAAAGSGVCAGNFHVIRDVNGFIEWGMTSQCTGNDWHPHVVTVQLETQVGGTWVQVLRRQSPAADQGKPVVVLHYNNDRCRTSTTNRYRAKGWINAGPHATSAISEVFSLACGDVEGRE